MSIYPNEKLKQARMEALCSKWRAEQADVQRAALNKAVERGDKETAANLARAIRNRLLKESDAEVALDRLNLTPPSGNTFSAWLEFLGQLGTALAGDWATYRQALRDLPNQEGFPMNIHWPGKPGDDET